MIILTSKIFSIFNINTIEKSARNVNNQFSNSVFIQRILYYFGIIFFSLKKNLNLF